MAAFSLEEICLDISLLPRASRRVAAAGPIGRQILLAVLHYSWVTHGILKSEYANIELFDTLIAAGLSRKPVRAKSMEIDK